MGEANVLQVSQLSQPALPHFHSVDVPIDANVSPKIKTKIWAHEFIDLGILLSSGAGDTRYHLSVSSPQGSSLPTLSLEPSHKPKNIPNIDSWTSAFQVFVGVYTAKFPMDDAPALVKYSKGVRDLAARGTYWRFYLWQFRLLRQSNPTEFPGGLRIGNSGSVLNTLIMHVFLRPKCLRANIRPMPDPWFPRVCVVNFIRGLITRAAVLNINVLNVSFTLHCGVIFVPNSPPLNQPQLLPNHALPTPVQIDKLRPLSCGYDEALTSNLCDGFTFGFPLHFKGDRISFFATNLISVQQNPEIVSAKYLKNWRLVALRNLSIAHLFPIFGCHD